MTDVSLLPTTGLVGTGCGWGSAGAAALGAFVGSWFGNGWGGNGFNRGGCGCGCGEGIAAGASAWGTNLVMDNLNQLQNSVGQVNAGINNLGLNLVQGQCAVQRQIGDAAYGVQNSLCQGFSGVNATVNSTTSQLMNANNQGFAGLNATINATNATTNNYLAQGFAGLNTAVQANGYESRLAVKDLAAQNASCCCEIKTLLLLMELLLVSLFRITTLANCRQNFAMLRVRLLLLKAMPLLLPLIKLRLRRLLVQFSHIFLEIPLLRQLQPLN